MGEITPSRPRIIYYFWAIVGLGAFLFVLIQERRMQLGIFYLGARALGLFEVGGLSSMLHPMPTASRTRTCESAGFCIRCQRPRARGLAKAQDAASVANGLAHEDLRKRRLLYPFQTASRTRTCESTGCCIRCQRSRARGLARAQSAVSAANGLAHKGLRMSKMLSSLPTASRARTSESAGCCIRCQRSRARGLPKAQGAVCIANGLAREDFRKHRILYPLPTASRTR